MPAAFQILCHVVKGAHQLGHLSARLDGYAVLQLAVGNLIHRIRERFHGPCDLLGQDTGQPHAEEKYQGRNHQQQEGVGRPDTVARAKQRPVLGRARTNLAGRLAQTLRHRQPYNHQASGGRSRDSGSELAFLPSALHHQNRLIIALGHCQQVSVNRSIQGNRIGLAFVEPRQQAALAAFIRELISQQALLVLPVDGDIAALNRDPPRMDLGVRRRYVFVQRAGSGDRLRLQSRIRSCIMLHLQHHAGRVLPQLRRRLRKPPVDRAVHQAKAEEKHECRRHQRDQSRAHRQTCAQSRSQRTAALIHEQLDDISDQQHQDRKQNQKHKHRRRRKDQNLGGRLRRQPSVAAGIEGIQRRQSRQNHERARGQPGDGSTAWSAKK